jgi:hypothetical protein
MPPAPSRKDLKPRKETMSGIWRSPALKPKSATRSGQRITTSMPNIILGPYAWTEKERKTLCGDCQIRRSNFATAAASEPADPVAIAVLARGFTCKFQARLRSTSIVSGGDYRLSEEDSGPTPPVRAFKLVDQKVAASRMSALRRATCERWLSVSALVMSVSSRWRCFTVCEQRAVACQPQTACCSRTCRSF